ncbi:4'-phosphopantetheinyl transferase superfamily protein [Hyphococcus flavus]|jgi:4'-phosphopantetheinyl transferase|uniref:4'-phosphopantetheinyl transferase superfamily protein n=1 Tax=Hyphococcus flavus TaxID=1866326 RepID=A0AAE9ZCF4_9PROT|nr:4'-phosphopantetheinyl transferase superfamily protein [Hyphococcus flavus]MCA8887943.1 4'-phosphopantetheinyl transferase superfamily protein [Parvularculaceae bacterium]WDI31891.1 4'-phosphopantetheinyl transferase superfamily protein [Hyphococcus flavus]
MKQQSGLHETVEQHVKDIRRVVRTIGELQHDEKYTYAWALAGSSRSAPDVLLSPDLLPRVSPDGAVLLWAGTSEAPVGDLLQACERILSSDEIIRARSFRQEEDARSFVTAHAVLRLQLAAHHQCSPSELLFATGPNGKPHLIGIAGRKARSWLHFNLSHTRGRALIGLSTAPIGVDIEQIEEFPDMLETADLAFTPESRAILAACTGDVRTRLFYRFWTLGEAFIKATGLGISQGLDTFAFTPSVPPRLTRITPGYGQVSDWYFGLFGYAASG